MNNDDLDLRVATLLTQLQRTKDKAKETADKIANLQSELIELIDTHYSGAFESETVCGVVVRATRTSWDEDELREHLSPEQFESVTTRVVDTSRLEKAVQSGDLSLNDVADAMTVTHNRPYIRIK